jgi:hypothetical protein
MTSPCVRVKSTAPSSSISSDTRHSIFCLIEGLRRCRLGCKTIPVSKSSLVTDPPRTLEASHWARRRQRRFWIDGTFEKNLREAMERQLHRDAESIKAVLSTRPSRPARRRSNGEEILSEAALEARRALHTKIRELRAEKRSIATIALALRISRGLVRRVIHSHALPERGRHPVRPSLLDDFETHLRQRYEEGCRNASLMWREIREQGYRGSPRQVHRWVQMRRTEAAPTTPSAYRAASSESRSRAETGAEVVQLSKRQLVWALLLDPERLTAAERELVDVLRGQ